MMKLKKKSSHKKIKEERESQFGLTWLTCHSRHEIGIKKLDFQKKNLAKRSKLIKKTSSKKMHVNPG